MNTKETINKEIVKTISEVAKDKRYIDYCRKIAGSSLYEDLFQYVCLYLLEMDKDKLIMLHKSGGLRMYITRIIYISINSNRSEFKNQIFGKIKHDEINNLAIEDEDEADIYDCFNKISEEIKKEIFDNIKKNKYPASAKLFEIYVDCGSYIEVSRKTKIPYLTVRKHIQDFQKKIKRKIK